MPPTKNDNPTLLLKDAKLIFRNLAGRAREYNSEGDRNFSVLLTPELAKQMLEQGWRVKQLKPRDGEEEGDYHIKVTANYKTGRPPRVVLINGNTRTELGVPVDHEDTKADVGIVDAIDIANADVFINGWWSDMAGGGYSAFLKTMFVTVHFDPLEQMYQEQFENSEQQDASADLEDADV